MYNCITVQPTVNAVNCHEKARRVPPPAAITLPHASIQQADACNVASNDCVYVLRLVVVCKDETSWSIARPTMCYHLQGAPRKVSQGSA